VLELFAGVGAIARAATSVGLQADVRPLASP
jgi:hypothetical protein